MNYIALIYSSLSILFHIRALTCRLRPSSGTAYFFYISRYRLVDIELIIMYRESHYQNYEITPIKRANEQ